MNVCVCMCGHFERWVYNCVLFQGCLHKLLFVWVYENMGLCLGYRIVLFHLSRLVRRSVSSPTSRLMVTDTLPVDYKQSSGMYANRSDNFSATIHNCQVYSGVGAL